MVTAWSLEVLGRTHDTYIACRDAPDWHQVDARYGTHLTSQPPRFIRCRQGSELPHRSGQPRLRHFARVLALREKARIARHLRPDLWLTADNSIFGPGRSLAYLHYPEVQGGALAPPAPPLSWPAARRFAYRAYHQGLEWLVPHDPPQVEAHLIAVNSEWTRREVRNLLGVESRVIYPPVPPMPPGRPWAQRENRVVLLGRWAPEKRLDLAIALVDEARRRGAADLRLDLVGFWDMPVADRALLVADTADKPWVTWHEHLARPQVAELAGRARFGLNAMRGEHFGIAIAELMSAGCITLVAASGGAPEVVGNPALTYEHPAAGAALLARLHGAADEQVLLHHEARRRSRMFAPEQFAAGLQALFADHADHGAAPSR